MNIRIGKVTHAELRWVASNLRQEDDQEVQAATGMSPEEALMLAHQSHDILGAYIGDSKVPALVFGCEPKPLVPSVGIPWMLCTPEIRKAPLAILKISRNMVDLWLQEYERLENYMDSRNLLHAHWVEKLGFTFDAHDVKNINGVFFWRFYKNRE